MKLGLGGYFSNPIDSPVDIIEAAYMNGIRFFDTAPAYRSEEYFGEALGKFPRHKFMLSTKTKATTSKELMMDFYSSCRNMKTDYLDVYFGHDFINDDTTWHQSHDVLEKMFHMRNEGLILEIGVSGHSTTAAIKAIQAGVDYIMVPHSIMNRLFENVILYAKSKKVKVITMKNFGSGVLLGGPEENEFKKRVTLKDIVSFSMYTPGVSRIIPAARSINQLQEIIVAHSLAKTLSQNEINLLERTIVEFLGEDFCRFCNMCRPCDVHGWMMSQPGILKSMIYDKAFGHDQLETYKGYKLNASDCKDCSNLCASRCPFGIDIKGEMEKAHLYFTGDELHV